MSFSVHSLVELAIFLLHMGEIDKNNAPHSCVIHVSNLHKTKRQKLIYIAATLAVLAITGVFLIGQQLGFIWLTLVGASLIILVSAFARISAHKMLTLFVGANIVLDVIAIATWAGFPSTQWSIYQLSFTFVGAEAAVAAAVYAATLFGLVKKMNWAPYLAVAMTVIQRCFATYMFFPSTAIAVTAIWSLLIIYFAVRYIKSK